MIVKLMSPSTSKEACVVAAPASALQQKGDDAEYVWNKCPIPSNCRASIRSVQSVWMDDDQSMQHLPNNLAGNIRSADKLFLLERYFITAEISSRGNPKQ